MQVCHIFSQYVSMLFKLVQYYDLNRLNHVVLVVKYLHWIYRLANLDRFGNLHKDSEVSAWVLYIVLKQYFMYRLHKSLFWKIAITFTPLLNLASSNPNRSMTLYTKRPRLDEKWIVWGLSSDPNTSILCAIVNSKTVFSYYCFSTMC